MAIGLPPSPGNEEFDYAWNKLTMGLRSLYPMTKQKIDFSDMAHAVADRLIAGDEAAAWVDDYVNEKVSKKKLLHFIQSATAYIIQARHLHSQGSSEAWIHLANAYFMAGMANLQTNIQRGADKKAEKYVPLKKTMMDLAVTRCPPERWADLRAIWSAIEDDVQLANESSENPAPRDDVEAAFNRLSKDEEREFFISLLTDKKIKRGRPKKEPAAS